MAHASDALLILVVDAAAVRALEGGDPVGQLLAALQPLVLAALAAGWAVDPKQEGAPRRGDLPGEVNAG